LGVLIICLSLRKKISGKEKNSKDNDFREAFARQLTENLGSKSVIQLMLKETLYVDLDNSSPIPLNILLQDKLNSLSIEITEIKEQLKTISLQYNVSHNLTYDEIKYSLEEPLQYFIKAEQTMSTELLNKLSILSEKITHLEELIKKEKTNRPIL
jgi:hypothetical protein